MIYSGNNLSGNEKFKIDDIINFDYSGIEQSITLLTGKYKFEAWGAKGADGGGTVEIPGGLGGSGGYISGILDTKKKINFPILVGGTNGWNRGGPGGKGDGSVENDAGVDNSGGNGGGATDICIDVNTPAHRFIVAPGGGGGGGRGIGGTEISYYGSRGGNVSNINGVAGDANIGTSATYYGTANGGGAPSQSAHGGGGSSTAPTLTTNTGSLVAVMGFPGGGGGGGGGRYNGGGGGGGGRLKNNGGNVRTAGTAGTAGNEISAGSGGAGAVAIATNYVNGGAGGASGSPYIPGAPSHTAHIGGIVFSNITVIGGANTLEDPRTGEATTGNKGDGYVRITVLDVIINLNVLEGINLFKQGSTYTLGIDNKGEFNISTATYQWQLDENDGNGFLNIAGAINSTLILANIESYMKGWKYRVIINDASYVITSNAYIVKVGFNNIFVLSKLLRGKRWSPPKLGFILGSGMVIAHTDKPEYRKPRTDPIETWWNIPDNAYLPDPEIKVSLIQGDLENVEINISKWGSAARREFIVGDQPLDRYRDVFNTKYEDISITAMGSVDDRQSMSIVNILEEIIIPPKVSIIPSNELGYFTADVEWNSIDDLYYDIEGIWTKAEQNQWNLTIFDEIKFKTQSKFYNMVSDEISITMLSKFWDIIRGENSSQLMILHNLNLISDLYDVYDVVWESSNIDVVNLDGEVVVDDIEIIDVILTAKLYINSVIQCDPIVFNLRVGNPESLLYFAANAGNYSDGYYDVTCNGVTYNTELVNIRDSVNLLNGPNWGDIQADGTMLIVRIDGNLTINNGVMVTSRTRRKGFLIYVTGTLRNNGTISMTSRGAHAVGQSVHLWKDHDTNSYITIPACSDTTSDYNPLLQGYSAYCGSSYSGGAGRGGYAGSTQPSIGGPGAGTGLIDSVGILCGGPGEAGRSGSSSNSGGGGGAGNPGGPGGAGGSAVGTKPGTSGGSGTGGLLILYANQILNNIGLLESRGSNGGSGGQATNMSGARGGGSGGGCITVFYNYGSISNINNTNIQVNGGLTNGGVGTINIHQIDIDDIL